MTIAQQITEGIKTALAEFKSTFSPAAPAVETAPATETASSCSITESIRAEILAPVQKELTGANAALATMTAERDTLKADVAAKDAKITELENTIKDPAGKIEKLASLKAREISAAQGAAPITVQPTAANPADVKSAATAGLKGRERVEASIKTELDKNFPAPARN